MDGRTAFPCLFVVSAVWLFLVVVSVCWLAGSLTHSGAARDDNDVDDDAPMNKRNKTCKLEAKLCCWAALQDLPRIGRMMLFVVVL